MTYGVANTLGAQSFTLECWFMRTGTGAFTTTGTGGVLAIPLISKGMAEGDNSTLDMNYFLGINSTTKVTDRSYGPSNVLVADFEEGTGSSSPGLNHPVAGVTPIANDVWYHAAVTYDVSNRQWRLYLNGNLEKDTLLAAGTRFPQFNSTQHAALGTALQSNGLPGASTYGPGYFNGIIDEARIWNYARTEEEIQATVNSQITAFQTGLLARWGLNEGTGTNVNSSAGTIVTGTITGTSYSWTTPGAPFNISFTTPADPSNLSATPLPGNNIILAWADNSGNETGFEIERSTTGAGGPFTPLATVLTNIITYTDQNLTEGNSYCYQVRAISDFGPSVNYSNISCATSQTDPNNALGLNTGSYVTFGAATSLASQNFTVEAWFRRTGTGTSSTTGSDGIDIIPILAKGAPEADNSLVDANYILGINTSGNVIGADFEEGTLSATPGLNHPLSGTTAIQNDVWYHAAATFSDGVFSVYLNGVLEDSETLGAAIWPQGSSTQHSALGTMLESDGISTNGFFTGVIDEARIWNYARSEADIQSTINSQIVASQTGLLARWGLNEGTGTAVNGSAGTSVNGTIVNTGYSWVNPGAPFDLSFTSLVAPTNLGATVLSTTSVRLDWTDNSDNETGFEIERSTTGSSGPYTLLASVSPDAVSYTDLGLAPATEYCYRVRATGDQGNSGYSNTSCATTTSNNATVSFQDGVNGYSGTVDTYIWSATI